MTKKTKERNRRLNAAVRLLLKHTDHELIIMADPSVPVYIVPVILTKGMTEYPSRVGRVEYQVSDGLPGKRSSSLDVYELTEALVVYGRIQRDGWR